MNCACCPHCDGNKYPNNLCQHAPWQGGCSKCMEEGNLTTLLNLIRDYKHEHAVNSPAYANFTALQTSIRNRIATLNKEPADAATQS